MKSFPEGWSSNVYFGCFKCNAKGSNVNGRVYICFKTDGEILVFFTFLWWIL